VHNHISEFRSEYLTLIRRVEDVRRRPTRIDFHENDESLFIVWLDEQMMSAPAMISFIRDQHRAGRIGDIQALSMLEPRMLGGATQTSYAVTSKDSWSVQGIAASSGIASGHLIWPGSSESDARRNACIFVCREVSPDDTPILRLCVGAFSTRGGRTSHLAVISRGLQIPAVVGIDDLELDIRHKMILRHGERLSGNSASVYGDIGVVALGDNKPLLRAVRKFESSSSMSFIDWVDDLAQSVVDRGEFAGLPVSLQTHIATLRQRARKIRVGHD
jgi:pyruvate,orthophosphate dikinase